MGKKKPPVSKQVEVRSASTSSVEEVEEDEVVTMAAVKDLLAVQESVMKAMFESVVSSINTRVDELVKSVASIKASVEFSQKELDDLKPISSKLQEAEGELDQIQGSLEYLENQSRRNNIRVSGIKESPGESWDDAEAKVKETVKKALGIDLDIERAHRVAKRTSKTKAKDGEQDRPRTIVCRLRDWKQREAVIREARKVKPVGVYVAEDLARATLAKREGQINKMKEARKAGKIAYFVLDRLIIRDKINEQSIDK